MRFAVTWGSSTARHARPGRRSTRRPLARSAVAALVVALMAAPTAALSVDVPDPDIAANADQSVWGANGRVMDIATIGNKALIGGGFDYVGPTTGHDAVVDSSTGAVVGEPKLINGTVNDIVADGSGGYYLGGDFSQVYGAPFRGVAHIKADGTLDRGFKPKVSGTVYALELTSAGLYIGGKFNAVKGTSRSNLALVGLRGDVVTAWNGSANSTVRDIVAVSDGVAVAGDFSTVNSANRRGLAVLDATTGATKAGFSGSTDGAVAALALSPDGSVLYAGGNFTAASAGSGSILRPRLAAFNASTGAVTSWMPAPNGRVEALDVDAATGNVHVGGLFSSLASGSRTSYGVVTPAGELSPFTADITGCHTPHNTKYVYDLPPCSMQVGAVTVDDGQVYLGGNFLTVKGSSRHHAASLSLTSGAVTDWNPVVGNKVLAIQPMGSTTAIGGEFTSVGGMLSKGLALIDLTTGEADPAFSADADGMVLDLELTPDLSTVYVAGDFDYIGGQKRRGIAKVNAATGAIDTGFNSRVNRTVVKAALAPDGLYLAGKFTRVRGETRGHAAKVDSETGEVDPHWVANTYGPKGRVRFQGMVQGLAVAPDGSKVYLAGPFTHVNDVPVSGGILVVDGITGARTAKQLGGVQRCSSLGPWINRLYLSPDGQRLYGGDVCPDNIYQWDAVNLGTPERPTGLLWRTWCNAGMQGALEVNGHFYYGSHGGNRGHGGACSSTPGGASVERQRFVVFAQSNGNLLPTVRDFDTPMGVWAYADSPFGLLVGGDMTLSGDRQTVQQGLALFRGTP